MEEEHYGGGFHWKCLHTANRRRKKRFEAKKEKIEKHIGRFNIHLQGKT